MNYWEVNALTKDEIKELYSMRDIVGRYGFIPNRRGFISCAFHEGDRTPSLKVYEKDFYCHACGAVGDIFTFVQLMEDVDFKEAFRILGGTYHETSRKSVAIRRAEFKRKRAQIEAENKAFKTWWKKRFCQICRLLRILDQLLPQYVPFSAEWCVAIEMKVRNEYEYQVLANGTREEQEEMRRQDE